MLNKVALDSSVWNTLNANQVPKLLANFLHTANTEADQYLELLDYLWDASVRSAASYAALPHLIEFALTHNFTEMISLWCDIGMCLTGEEPYIDSVPTEVMTLFNEALALAECVFPSLLASNCEVSHTNASYLISTLFGFARHPIGQIAVSNFFANEPVGESLICCPNGHENDVIIRCDSTIAPISEYGKKYMPQAIIVPPSEIELPSDVAQPNESWNVFTLPLTSILNDEHMPLEVKGHINLAIMIIQSGVTPQLPTRYAFSLLGSLLYWLGQKELALRTFHAWDNIICKTCGQQFCFANQWSMCN